MTAVPRRTMRTRLAPSLWFALMVGLDRYHGVQEPDLNPMDSGRVARERGRTTFAPEATTPGGATRERLLSYGAHDRNAVTTRAQDCMYEPEILKHATRPTRRRHDDGVGRQHRRAHGPVLGERRGRVHIWDPWRGEHPFRPRAGSVIDSLHAGPSRTGGFLHGRGVRPSDRQGGRLFGDARPGCDQLAAGCR